MAALQLNGIFEAAQAAGQQYIENIKDLSERQDAICAERDARNKIEIENRLRETAVKCAEMEANSRKKCEWHAAALVPKRWMNTGKRSPRACNRFTTTTES